MAARDDFVRCARQAVGVYRYCTPSIEEHCYDCSGLVKMCWQQATGYVITGDSHAQFQLGTAPEVVSPGDLMFFDTGYSQRLGNRASHVGIYVGDGKMVNALNEDSGIVVNDIRSDYWKTRYLGSRCLFGDVDASPEPPAPMKPSTPDTAPSTRPPHRGPERERERDRRRFWQRVSDTVRRRRVRP